MNTLQTTLTALQSQLEAQREAATYYTENVFNKEVANLESTIVDWFDHLVGEKYKITYRGEELQIFTSDEPDLWSHNAISVRYYAQYKEKAKAKLSWYGSNCDYDDVKNIKYLKTLGHVATLMGHINFMMPTWQEEYQQYSQKLYAAFLQPISHTEDAIRKTERQIVNEGIASYKAPGFKHTISPKKVCERHFEINLDNPQAYTLEVKSQFFDLQYGRSKYENTRVYAFEVVGEGKRGKIDMNILSSATHSTFERISVSKSYFEDFITTVYNWETRNRAMQDEKETRKYNNHMEKFVVTA